METVCENTSPCDYAELLEQRVVVLEELHSDVREIKQTITEVRDLLKTWNNIKGFATTMSWIAGFLKVLAIVGTAAGLIWWALTGHPK